jgi:hypothetical protein
VPLKIGYENGSSSPSCIRVAACISDFSAIIRAHSTIARPNQTYGNRVFPNVDTWPNRDLKATAGLLDSAYQCLQK